MKRLLASLSLIALALGIVAIGGVQALFTDTGADSGGVAAGGICIRLNTLKHTDEVVWDIPPCVSDNMSPGDVCSDTLTVHNDGSVWLTYTVGVIETDCFEVTFTGPFDTSNAGDPAGPPYAGQLPPNDAEPETISATVTLVDDDDCQGLSASVGISVSAASIPTP